jgi:acyl-CoA synthetase (AMP-forming)/AMP-acid ligase II
VELTHRNLYLHALSCIATLAMKESDVTLVGGVPLFHVNAWGAPHYMVALGGTQSVISRFDPNLFCQAVERDRVTRTGLVPTMLAALLAFPEKFRGKKCGLVITGGNIDTRLLASVLTRELVREQRLVSLRIIGDDRPGLLANVATIIGQMGSNIIEVAHNRLALDVPAKGAEFDIMIETRDAQHTQEIMDALRERGYPPRAV